MRSVFADLDRQGRHGCGEGWMLWIGEPCFFSTRNTFAMAAVGAGDPVRRLRPVSG